LDLKEESLLGDQVHRHWYYRAKLAALFRAIEGLPPCAVLDVGAGSGYFSRALLEAGRAEKATCVDTGYLADRAEVIAGRPLLFRRALAPQDADVGMVIMMDVLEHVEDDVGLAKAYIDQIPSGTHVIVTVPAFRWLWSKHDVFLGHYRRYSLLEIEKVMQSAGLRIEFGSYYYGTILPIAAAFRLGQVLLGGRGQEPKSDMRQFGSVLNTLLWSVCRAELTFFRVNRVAGLSAFVRAVKP
jgi:hypothetical protein